MDDYALPDAEDEKRQLEYADVVGEIRRFLEGRAEDCQKAGMRPHHIVIDPGIGFGKTQTHNLCLAKASAGLCRGGLCGAAGREPQTLHGRHLQGRNAH